MTNFDSCWNVNSRWRY